MKAIVCTKYGPPEVLQMQEVEKQYPKDKKVLIKIFATAVTASDCIIRGLTVSPGRRLAMRLVLGFTKPRQPILGMVFAGEVESTGKAIHHSKKVTRYSAGTSSPLLARMRNTNAFPKQGCWRSNPTI